MFSVSPSTVFKWVRKFGTPLGPTPEAAAEGAVFLDDAALLEYLKTQHNRCGSGAIFVVIPEDVSSENVVIGIKRGNRASENT